MLTARPATLPEAIAALGRAAAVAAALVGLTVIVGWLADVDALKAFAANGVTMKANAAIAVLLMAFATATSWTRIRVRVGGIAAAAAAVLASLTLVEEVADVNLHIDQFLFHEAPGALQTASPGRMSANLSIGVVLLAVAILLGLAGRLELVAEALAAAGGLLGLLGLVGRVSGTSSLSGFGEATHISIPGGLALLLLAISLLLARESRLARLLGAPGPGGLLVRRLLPAVVLLPVAVGGLVAWGLSRGLIGARLEDWLLISTLMVVAGVFLVWTGSSLERLDAERAAAAAELHEANEQLRVLIDSSPLAVAVLDPEGNVRLWNQAAEDTFGWSSDEVLGRPYPVVEESDRERFASDLRLVVTGSPATVARRRRRKDGSGLWVHSARAPLRGADGSVSGVIVVSVDISERVAAEEAIRQMNVELERRVADRTSALTIANRELEAFSYSVSHDLRAPLRAIDGFGKALLEDYAQVLDETAHDYVGRMRAASQRMGQLIDDLLKLSRLSRSELHPARVDLSQQALTIVQELRDAEPEREVEFVVQEGLRTTGDPDLLRVGLTNLIGNAWKFTRNAEHARIELGGEVREQELVLWVRDNGVGFDPAYVDRLFTPFQRLHSQVDFPGSGIGLATVSRVIRRHDGRVWADASPGEGATFFFTLPRREEDE